MATPRSYSSTITLPSITQRAPLDRTHRLQFADMADHTEPSGQPNSMSSLGEPQNASDNSDPYGWDYIYEGPQRVLMTSPGFQQFRYNTAGTWAPDHKQFLSPSLSREQVRYKQADESGMHSPSSGTTMKPSAGIDEDKAEGGPLATLTPNSPASGTTITPDGHDDREKTEHLALALREPLADATALITDQARVHPKMYSLPSPWNPTITNAKSRSRASSGAVSAASFLTDYSDTKSVGSEDSSGCMSPLSKADPNSSPRSGHDLHSPHVTDTNCGYKDLHVLETSHHSRRSSRLSSLPAIPSPLGLGHIKNDLSDGSGLTSALHSSPRPRSWQQEHAPQKSPGIFGLHAKGPNIGHKSAPGLKSTGPGHERRHEDPFIDYADEWPYYSPRTAQYFTLQPTLPTHSASTTASSQISFAVPYAGYPGAPTVQSNVTSTRDDLPIPPSPLPFIEGKYTHTAEARAHLNAQKVVRADWINIEGKKIADLSRMRYAAAQQYQQTGSSENHENWQRAEIALATATDLEKRQAERRKMFLPHGTVPMRTSPGNPVGDSSASYPPATNGDSVGGYHTSGDDRLLGFQMAIMERVCAEIKHRHRDEASAGEITGEMLNTLTLEEKKVLREHLVARLRSGTETRSRNWESHDVGNVGTCKP